MLRATCMARSTVFGLGDFADQAGLLGTAGSDGFAGQDHLHGQRLTDGTQQALGAAGTGDDAEVDFRLAETGVGTGDDDVGAHCQFAAATQGVTIDGGNQRFGECGDALPVATRGSLRMPTRSLGHFLMSAPAANALAAAGNHGPVCSSPLQPAAAASSASSSVHRAFKASGRCRVMS
jgi:hypothetical protein